MPSFLLSLLTASVSMSALILLYMAVTPLLSKRYSEKGRYYAWLVIAIGLLIPFRPQFGSAFVQMDIPVADSGASALAGVPVVYLPTYMSPVAQEPASLSGWHIAGHIWLAGLALFLAFHLIKHLRFMRTVRRWRWRITDERVLALFEAVKSEMGVTGKIALFECVGLESPMLYGLLAPRILLPELQQANDELRFIFKHELVHYKRKDLLYKGLVLAATAVHWFNPFVYLMARAVSKQCELSCDAEVIRGANTETRSRYSETIIGAIQRHTPLQTALSTHYNGGKKDMKNRISSIMDTSKKKSVIFIVCLMALFSAASGTIFAAQTQPDHELAEALEREALIVSSWEELIEPLATMGLGFMRVTEDPPLRNTLCLTTIHIGNLDPDIPIRITTTDDVDVLLALIRLAVEQNRIAISYETHIEEAIEAAGLHDYWREGSRTITRPTLERQFRDMAENYSFEEIMEMHKYRREYILQIFHEMGMFLDITPESLADGSWR